MSKKWEKLEALRSGLDHNEEIKTAKVTRHKMYKYRMFRFNGDETKHWDGIRIIFKGQELVKIDISDDGEIVFFDKNENVQVVTL